MKASSRLSSATSASSSSVSIERPSASRAFQHAAIETAGVLGEGAAGGWAQVHHVPATVEFELHGPRALEWGELVEQVLRNRIGGDEVRVPVSDERAQRRVLGACHLQLSQRTGK